MSRTKASVGFSFKPPPIRRPKRGYRAQLLQHIIYYRVAKDRAVFLERWYIPYIKIVTTPSYLLESLNNGEHFCESTNVEKDIGLVVPTFVDHRF